MTRKFIIKLRVNENERDIIAAKAAEVDMTVSDFIRLRTLNFRLRKSAAQRDKIRELARIGSNINQLARWVNVHKGIPPRQRAGSRAGKLSNKVGLSRPNRNAAGSFKKRSRYYPHPDRRPNQSLEIQRRGLLMV